MTFRIAAVLAFTVLSLGLAPATGVRAETYLGDFCWQMSFEGSPETGSLKLGVYEKDGGHFELYGTISDDGSTTAILGSAEIIGDEVYLTAVDSGFISDLILSNTTNAVLNASTLNGTFTRSFLVVDSETTFVDVFFSIGTLTLIDCP